MTINEWKTVKVPPALHAVCKSEAAKHGISLTDFMEIIMLDWIKRQGLHSPPAQSKSSKLTDLFLVGLESIPND